MSKLRDYTFSIDFRKKTEFLDFVEDVRNSINNTMTAQVAKIESIGQTGDIASTTIITPSTAWFFRASVYLICTTAGGGTLSFTLAWNDAAGAKTLSPASDIVLDNVANGSTGNEFIVANASAISFSTAIASKTGNPVYNAYLILEQIG